MGSDEVLALYGVVEREVRVETERMLNEAVESSVLR
jgi:hypothetical protein